MRAGVSTPAKFRKKRARPFKPASAGCALALPSEVADASAGPQAFPHFLVRGFAVFLRASPAFTLSSFSPATSAIGSHPGMP